jgi:hypothetical protein
VTILDVRERIKTLRAGTDRVGAFQVHPRADAHLHGLGHYRVIATSPDDVDRGCGGVRLKTRAVRVIDDRHGEGPRRRPGLPPRNCSCYVGAGLVKKNAAASLLIW